jgi:hypothetical protein
LVNGENKLKAEEMDLIKAVTDKLKKIKEDEIKQVEKNLQAQIAEEKAKVNVQAEKVMQLVDDETKLKDHSKCVDNRVSRKFVILIFIIFRIR